MKVVRSRQLAQAHRIKSQESDHVLTACGQKLSKFEVKMKYTIRAGGLCGHVRCFGAVKLEDAGERFIRQWRAIT